MKAVDLRILLLRQRMFSAEREEFYCHQMLCLDLIRWTQDVIH